MNTLTPNRTSPTPPPFAPNTTAFIERIEKSREHSDAEHAAAAKAHILMFSSRVAAAMSAINDGHLGSARAFLMIGKMDYEAAINALPE